MTVIYYLSVFGAPVLVEGVFDNFYGLTASDCVWVVPGTWPE